MLLGREPELLAIDQALAAARLGTSSRLLIRGEPGIGKTALLEHAVSQAASMRVLAARGVEFEADVPFAGLHELLHPTLVLLDRLPQRHAAALRSSLGLGPRIEADRLIIGAAALGLISAYAEDRPLLPPRHMTPSRSRPGSGGHTSGAPTVCRKAQGACCSWWPRPGHPSCGWSRPPRRRSG